MSQRMRRGEPLDAPTPQRQADETPGQAPSDEQPLDQASRPGDYSALSRRLLVDAGARGWRWLRRGLNLRSLTTQMALGSVLITLISLIVIGGASVIAIRDTFNNVQRAQLVDETQQVAVAMGQPNATSATAGLVVATRRETLTVWLMDSSGRVTLAPSAVSGQDGGDSSADTQAIEAALRRALGGQLQQVTIASDNAPPFAQRFCVAAPIHSGGASGGRIIGSVALANTPVATRPPFTRYALAAEQTILTTLLVMMGIAALLAILYSRRVTRPLARLRIASARMMEGDYAARAPTHDAAAPDELHALALTFNEMAGALERDVNELRRQERLRRELLANISHELATPLTSIQGYTEALIDGVIHDDGAREETTRMIARQSARLRRLVDQLRQVALFEGGAGLLNCASVALGPLIDETLAVLAPESERLGVTLTAEMMPNLPPVQADADRLTEIFLNLLDNALRYTPPGGAVAVTVTRAAPPHGGMAQISVTDSGPGVAPADRARVFERFTRLDDSRASTTGGSGLGLAIVKSLVEAHGGTIRLDERPGGGARFTFTLPFA